jgi:hypothetical protein
MAFIGRRRDHLQREQRRVARTAREDAAGKLAVQAPELEGLSLNLEESRADGSLGDTHYIRRVVVEHAPALFHVPCSYPPCVDGGYELTPEILLAVASRKLRFEGTQRCPGRCGAAECGRVLRYVATASYRPRVAAAEAPPSA